MKWSLETLPDAMTRSTAMRFLVTALGPSRGLFEAGAILVNREGRRFANELGRPAEAVPGQPERMAYIVFDAAIAAKFQAWPNFVSTAPGIAYAYIDDYRRGRRDIFHEAADPGALAKSLGVSRAALSEAISRTPGLRTPPYFALGPVKSYVVFTDGGLAVDTRLAVLGGTGAPIPGLFAAGSTGQGGVLLEGHGHHLGWAFVSGRIAGRNAALKIGGR